MLMDFTYQNWNFRKKKVIEATTGMSRENLGK